MTHWPSMWFEVRAEMGQSDVATMMYQDVGHPLQKHHFHHRETDGFGKIQSLLQQEGLNVQAPIRKLKKPPRYLNFYLLLKGLLTHPVLPHNPWKNYYPERVSGPPDDVSSWFMTMEESEKVKKAAADKGLNLGFFLLSEFNNIVKKNLFHNPEDPGTWLVPVDMRGAYHNSSFQQNFVSFLPIVIDSKNVMSAFEKYKQDLRSGAYWAFWELAQIGQYVGLGGMRWLAKKGTGKSFWMGSFSDLGVWDQKELLNSKAKDRYWSMAPPGSLAYPIGMTTIEWCGHRSITIKIHPALCDRSSKDVSDQILEEFKQTVLKTIPKP